MTISPSVLKWTAWTSIQLKKSLMNKVDDSGPIYMVLGVQKG